MSSASPASLAANVAAARHLLRKKMPALYRIHEKPSAEKLADLGQLLAELVRRGHLDVDLGGRTVTYHDPCYLGRHNGIFEEPRELLKMIPGLELSEMPDSRSATQRSQAMRVGFWVREYS